MTTRNQTCKAAIRRNLHGVLRATITASLFACAAPVANAQTDLLLPTFPTAGLTAQLPVADEIAFPFPSKGTEKVLALPSAGATAIGLLGLNKNGVHPVAKQGVVNGKVADSKAAIPNFPLTFTANQVVPVKSGELLAAKPQVTTNAPDICLSSGSFQSKIVLASATSTDNAEGVPKQVETESVELPVVEQNTSEVMLAEAVASNSSESLTESLIDIDLPSFEAIPTNAQSTPPRQPEIVKRRAAMQLHIGSQGKSDTSNPQSATESSNLASIAKQGSPITSRLSDQPLSTASDAPQEQAKQRVVQRHHVAASKPMTLHIEGEPTPGRPATSGSATVKGPTATAKHPSARIPDLPPPAASSNFPKITANVVQASLQAISLPASANLTTQPNDKQELPSTVSPSSDPSLGERVKVAVKDSVVIESLQPIENVSIEHPEFCQVLKGSERSLTLIGLRAGMTRIAVFTTDSTGERKVAVHEVTIGGSAARQADAQALATEITHAIRKMYPQSRVEVIEEANGLTVQGAAASEDEAVKIVGLVRRTSLQPVLDRITTYK